MPGKRYKYVIVGGGSAAAAAVEGIRDRDGTGSVLLLGREKHLPYDRPPLSKDLWLGAKKLEDVFVHDRSFYADKGVDVLLGTDVVQIDPTSKGVYTANGGVYGYDACLLATGGSPRILDLPGGQLPGICYYRYLDDYPSEPKHFAGKDVTVIGGGFIGSELAAVLSANDAHVTMVFPEDYVVQRIFPEGLGRAVQAALDAHGVRILSRDVPVGFAREGGKLVTSTRGGERLVAERVIVGIGIRPATALASGAGLAADNGVLVNERLQTSDNDVYAAGDNASFPYQVLGRRMRVEHWDNAVSQGRHAGRNMTGDVTPYTYMPYFFSDIFDFGYEAVGDVDSHLNTFADWHEENRQGVIYYLHDGFVRGVMLCGVWGQLDAARRIIRAGERVEPQDLRGAIVSQR